MISRILVGLGGTPYAEAATRTAIAIAKRHDAAVTGVTVVNLEALEHVGPTPLGAGQAAKELREHRVAITRQNIQDMVEQFAAMCEEAGVHWKVKKEERNEPFNFLISRARYHDLTVLGLRALFEYGVATGPERDPALALVKLLSAGVRPIVAVPKEVKPVTRVLAAYSGSVESAATLRQFLHMQPWLDFKLKIVTFAQSDERAHRLLDQTSKYCQGRGIDPEVEHINKTPQEGLLEEAVAWDADLIVLGNSAKSLLMRRMLGETALRVIRQAELPLFLSQ